MEVDLVTIDIAVETSSIRVSQQPCAGRLLYWQETKSVSELQVLNTCQERRDLVVHMWSAGNSTVW
jgi:hypothetical protein